MMRAVVGTFAILLGVTLGAWGQASSGQASSAQKPAASLPDGPKPSSAATNTHKEADSPKTDSGKKDTEEEFPFPDPYKTTEPPHSDSAVPDSSSPDTSTSDSQKKKTEEEFPFPDPYKTNEPPCTEPRTGMDSSSKDQKVDLSPPSGDSSHPGSSLGGPDPNDSVTVMKPWDPHKADKDVEVGLFYFRDKNYRAAEARFRSALQWQDNHAEATYRLGTALEKEGKIAEARGYYEQYLKLTPAGDWAKDAKKALDRINADDSKKASISRP